MPLFDQAALTQQLANLSARPVAEQAGALPEGAPPPSLAALDRGSVWGPAAMTVAGNAADLGSTLWALKHEGVKEGNPIYGQNLGRIAATKIAATIPQILIEKMLVDRGHPTAAKALGALSLGWGASLAAHNIATVRGVQK